jgi:hypothetical protein
MLSTFPFNIWQGYEDLWYPEKFIGIFFWLNMEIVGIAGLAMSNIIFLMFRSCIRHKVSQTQGIKDEVQIAGTDTIIAIKSYVQMFNSQWIPLMVCLFV